MAKKGSSYIWVLTAEYLPHIIGGLGIAASYLTKEFGRIGLKVVVISKNPSNKISTIKKGNITTIRFPGSYSAGKIAKYMREHGYGLPGVLHIHSMEYVDLALLYKRKHSIPIVYTCHSMITKRGSRRVFSPARQALLLRNASRVVVPSTWQRNQLVNRYSFCKGKTVIISHGVVQRDGQSKVSPLRLLYVGRLVKQKGLEQLIDSLGLLKGKYPGLTLSIIGTGKRGYVRSLKIRARRRGVKHMVEWLGFYDQQRLHNAYQRYGAVVMPSEKESFGLVALEALAHGVPLISTQSGGLSEFVSSKVAAVIPRVQSKAIAQAISRVLGSAKQTKERVRAGKVLASAFSWQQVAMRYQKVFHQVG